jgi:exodeoxyribonuclease V alpha subunit
MLALEGIGPKHNEQVTKAWAVQKVVHKIMVFLQTHGIGSARTVRFHKTCPAGAEHSQHRTVITAQPRY